MLKTKKRVYRKWMKWPYGVVVILGVLLIITAAACIYPLPPEQVSPPAGSVFSGPPWTTTLEWKPLIGAATYRVEVDCFGCCTDNQQWCTDEGEEWRVAYTSESTYIFEKDVGIKARWRVSGVNGQEQEGQRSDWWEFTFSE